MYIEKYWGGSIGGTDDSLTLVEYLAEKNTAEISVREIFSDFGLNQMDGDFRNPETPCVFVIDGGWEMEIHYAIDLISDLAALLLECRVNGTVDLAELTDALESNRKIRITAEEEEDALLNRTILDFVREPMEYDASEMMDEDEIREMTEACEHVCRELYEGRLL